MTYVLVFKVAILQSLVVASSSLECYECTNTILDLCSEIEPSTSLLPTVRCGTSCFKWIIEKKDNSGNVFENAMNAITPAGVKRGCNDGSKPDGEYTKYDCDSDLCNTASPGMTSSFFAIVFTSLFTLSRIV